MSVSPSSRLRTSGRQGSRTLITRRWHALAVRPGKPYPATFRKQRLRVDRKGIEPFHRLCKSQSPPWNMPAHLCLTITQRSVRELNPVFIHTTDACCRNTYRPFVLVITDGIEPSVSCLSRRRLSRWTTRSCFRPSSRDRSRTCKITSLSCLPLCLFAYSTFASSGSGGRTRRSWLMRPG